MCNLRPLIFFIVSILTHAHLGAMESLGHGLKSTNDYNFFTEHCCVKISDYMAADFFKSLDKDFFPLCDKGLNPHKIPFLRKYPKEKSIRRAPTKETFIIFACRHNEIKVLERLLEYPGAEDIINVRDGDGNTALHYACLCSNIPLVKALLKVQGINGKINNVKYKTVFDVVVHNINYSSSIADNYAILKLLVNKFGSEASQSKL